MLKLGHAGNSLATCISVKGLTMTHETAVLHNEDVNGSY